MNVQVVTCPKCGHKMKDLMAPHSVMLVDGVLRDCVGDIVVVEKKPRFQPFQPPAVEATQTPAAPLVPPLPPPPPPHAPKPPVPPHELKPHEVQERELKRVRDAIGPAIVDFFKALKPGDRFRAEELHQHVQEQCGDVAPASADRVARALRQGKAIAYKCVNRASSLYEVGE